MEELKKTIIAKYFEYKEKFGKAPSSRDFYEFTKISERTLSKVFGSNYFTKLALECGDDPNKFSTEKISMDNILIQWGQILQKERKVPSQSDWLFYKCVPAIKNIQMSHGILWTELPKLFYDFAKDKPEYNDILSLIDISKNNDIINASDEKMPKLKSNEYFEYLPIIVSDLENLAEDENQSFDFEKKVNIVFQLLGFEIEDMGQGTGRNPDGIAKNRQNHYAIIIDAKSRKEKYSIGTEDRKFIEYIKKYLPVLKKEGIEFCYFIVVSSQFSNISSIAVNNIFKETNVKICFINAKNLLIILSDKIKNPNKNDLGKFKELLFQGGIIDNKMVNEYIKI
jgi:Restriction endonuclease FokI, C terminal